MDAALGTVNTVNEKFTNFSSFSNDPKFSLSGT